MWNCIWRSQRATNKYPLTTLLWPTRIVDLEELAQLKGNSIQCNSSGESSDKCGYMLPTVCATESVCVCVWVQLCECVCRHASMHVEARTQILTNIKSKQYTSSLYLATSNHLFLYPCLSMLSAIEHQFRLVAFTCTSLGLLTF